MPLFENLVLIVPEVTASQAVLYQHKVRKIMEHDVSLVPDLSPLKEVCTDCHSLTWDDVRIDDHTRDAVCTTCAVVINDHLLEDVPEIKCSLYSEERVFRSYLVGSNKGYKIPNHKIEDWLKGDLQSTTEQYKNQQRGHHLHSEGGLVSPLGFG